MIKLLLILLLFMSPVISYAGGVMLVGFGDSAPSCTSQSEDVVFTTGGDFQGVFSGGTTVGQSFKPGVTGTLYSISVYISYSNGADHTLAIRFGNSSDLSSSYTFEIANIPVGELYNTWYEVVIPQADRPSVTSGTTYWFNIQAPVDTVYLGTNDAGGYVNGTLYTGGTNWNAGSDSLKDALFKTKMCN